MSGTQAARGIGATALTMKFEMNNQSCRLRLSAAVVRVVCCLLIFVACAASARAQATGGRVPGTAANEAADETAAQTSGASTVDEGYVLRRNDDEFGVWGGGSFTARGFISALDANERAGRRFGIVGLRYGRVLGVRGGVAYEYTIDVIPVAVATNTEVLGREISVTLPNGTSLSGREVERGSVYGVGFNPIGLKFNFGARRRIKPFAAASAGFIHFREPVPVVDTTRTPFTFDFGGGVQFFTRGRQSLSVGYKFHHISNANTSRVNPGLDSNIVYAGYSFWK